MQDNAIRKGEPWMVQTLQLPASHDALDFPLRATWSQETLHRVQLCGDANHYQASVFLGRKRTASFIPLF